MQSWDPGEDLGLIRGPTESCGLQSRLSSCPRGREGSCCLPAPEAPAAGAVPCPDTLAPSSPVPRHDGCG